MVIRLKDVFRLRPGETSLVLTLGFLLLSNSLAHQVSDITAISSFLTAGGVNQILAVWGVGGLIIIATTGLQSLIVDRYNRVSLTRWMLICLILAFVALRLLFVLGAPGWLNYSLLYLLSDQQWLFFPLVFWILANDIFDTAQAQRLFPLIAGLGLVGKLLGVAVAAVAPELTIRLHAFELQDLLWLNALIYAIAYLLVSVGLRRVRVREIVQTRESPRDALAEGWTFVREVPAFRYLAVSILALLICETAIEFRFLVVSDGVFGDPLRYQQFYSLFRLGVIIASILVQGFFASRIIHWLRLRNTFFVMPVCVLLGAVGAILQPGLVGSVGGMVLLKLPQITVDESSRKAFESMVPEERRGRVSMFLDSYLYAIGIIVGCAITGIIVFVGTRMASTGYFYVYLGLAVVSACLAIAAIFRMRGVYDASLLNWRLKRRQRGRSVLDKIEF